MEKGLFYSEEGLLNRVLFYSDYNEINIFVEDENKEFIYEQIFQRMFNNEVKMVKVFPMKGKPGVEKAFQEYGCEHEGKPAFYLVDGDFDLVMSKKRIENANYIYLEKYNIESYYIDRKAVIKFMAGKMKKIQKVVEETVKFPEWENMIYNPMKELFINYMIAQDVFPSEKNVGISCYSYFNSDGYVNKVKIEEYVNQLKNRIPNYEEKYNTYSSNFETILGGDVTRLVCGKYLLASLSMYLRKIPNVKFGQDDFIYFLATSFDITTLNFVKDRIVNIIGKR